ncbi:Zn(II)2Cys6 transcription factor domain-containing protein [Aspergillus saccharolyticus JOP 1030-1]|uniref:Zn(2)-C6 fungal-type domain-containing protein n=1 Tax=Aspergillus saccharolyticus JOP 1030-1 TaxID=1450539 RepID=A0A318ZAB9_9EURO|nr:hypothetical protein BP01DRAFT_394858 [Aspergillus saccharolyticus JOP 1030-1]PYH41653.1 hypothetical protein BP01DRAFT_394858 [Aspergillus saccharolyticus JOP 1030-1]
MSDSLSPSEPAASHHPGHGPLTANERRRRVRHHKSRRGCFTCKHRRVKCDEVHPICGACAFRGDSCSYPPSVSSTFRVLKSPQISSSVTDPLQPLDFRLQEPAAESPLHDQAIGLADLRLLTRFMIYTSKKMSYHPTRQHVWEQLIPDLAAKHEYLMHLLLALAGEHVLYEAHMPKSFTEGEDDRQSSSPAYSQSELELEYQRVIQHHQKGLAGFRQALADMTPETAEYVFCGSLLIVAISFASISTREHYCTASGLNKSHSDRYPYTDWLHLVRGLTSVVREHWFTLKCGRLRMMLYYPHANDDWKADMPTVSSTFPRLKHAPQIFHVFAQGACQALDMLRAFATTLPSFRNALSPGEESIPTPSQSDAEPEHPNDYLHAIARLEEIYMRILYVLRFSHSDRNCSASLDIKMDMEDCAVTSWPTMLSTRFFDSLSAASERLTTEEGFSYTILAHFYVVSIIFRDLWYLSSGFRSEIQKVVRLVAPLRNPALSALLAWPMEVIAAC